MNVKKNFKSFKFKDFIQLLNYELENVKVDENDNNYDNGFGINPYNIFISTLFNYEIIPNIIKKIQSEYDINFQDEGYFIKYFDYLKYVFNSERKYHTEKKTPYSPYIALRFSKKSSDELNGTNKYTKRLNFIVFFHLRFNHDEKKTYVDSCTCDFVSWYVLTNYDYFYVKNNEINVKNNSLGGHYYFKTLIDIPNYQNLNFSELFDYITNYINTNSKKYFRKLSFLFAVQSQYRIKKIFFDWLKYIDNCSFTDLSFSQIINYLWKKTHANFDNLYYSEALHKNILNDTVFSKYIDDIYENSETKCDHSNDDYKNKKIIDIVSVIFKMVDIASTKESNINDLKEKEKYCSEIAKYLLFGEDEETHNIEITTQIRNNLTITVKYHNTNSSVLLMIPRNNKKSLIKESCLSIVQFLSLDEPNEGGRNNNRKYINYE